MRKLLLLSTFALCFSINNAIAQDGQDSGERQFALPEAGNFGLGFDAVPFLEYFGNIFNATQNNTIGANFPGGTQQIFGKYFLTDDRAIRGRLRLGHDRITDRNRVMLDNQQTPDPNVEVTDEWITSPTNVRLGGGIEFRRGSGRVIGVFGTEASLLYGRNVISYDFGNPITESNQAPTTTAPYGAVVNGRFERIIERKTNRQLGAGVNGFAGIEYYVATGVSLGAEFTLGVDFIRAFRQQDTYEFWDTNSGSVRTRTSIAEGGNTLSLDTGNYGGSINLMFYF